MTSRSSITPKQSSTLGTLALVGHSIARVHRPLCDADRPCETNSLVGKKTRNKQFHNRSCIQKDTSSRKKRLLDKTLVLTSNSSTSPSYGTRREAIQRPLSLGVVGTLSMFSRHLTKKRLEHISFMWDPKGGNRTPSITACCGYIFRVLSTSYQKQGCREGSRLGSVCCSLVWFRREPRLDRT